MTEGFPVGPCQACGADVLAYREPEGPHRCVHCDGPVEVRAAVGLEDLGQLGYGLVGAAREAKCSETGSCSLTGAPSAGPGTGACGGGTCGAAR